MSANYELFEELLSKGYSMEEIEEGWLRGLSLTELKDLGDEVAEYPLEYPTDDKLNPYNRTPEDIVWCQKKILEEEEEWLKKEVA